jgi:type II secretory pathway pseudopilin PulG
MKHRRADSAFMLVELMFVLGLLAVVALVATQIFLFNMRTSTQLSQQHQAQAQFDQATAQLRRDVWGASSLESQTAQVLNVKLADGREVTWHAGKALERTSNSQSRRWDALDADIAFEVRGPTVAIAVEPHKSDPGGKLTLVSQAMLLQGARQ